jgi:hypothetical protein
MRRLRQTGLAADEGPWRLNPNHGTVRLHVSNEMVVDKRKGNIGVDIDTPLFFSNIMPDLSGWPVSGFEF